MDLSIIIVTYNSTAYIPALFSSLKEERQRLQAGGRRCQVILVDNGSTDGGPDQAQAILEDAQVLRNERNTGFAAANNRGIQAAGGRMVLLLNPDVRLLPGALAAMMDFMDLDANCRVGVCGPRVLNPDGTIQASLYVRPTPWSEAAFMLGIAYFVRIPGLTTNEIPVSAVYQQAQEVDSVLGACLLCRREVIDQIGLLDAATFFLYGEELDWTLRARQAGWRVVYNPQAEIIHYGRQATDNRPAWQIVELYKSRFKLIAKYYGRVWAFLIRLAAELGLLSRLAYLGVNGLFFADRPGLGEQRLKARALLSWNTRTLFRPIPHL